MKNPIKDFPLCVALFLSAISDTQAVDCSLTAVNNRLQNCVNLQFSTLLNQQNVQSILSEACKSVDCAIGCYTRVYYGCSSTGIFQTIDMNAYKVATRYVCQNSQDTLVGLLNCGLASWTCFQDLIDTIASAVTQHSTSNATAYVSAYCRAATDFKTCTTSNPLSASGLCTETQASVLTNIFEVSFSIANCDIAQDSSLFTTYGAALDESACGADRIRGTIIMAVVVFSVALRWFL